jgi:hypothetical protein
LRNSCLSRSVHGGAPCGLKQRREPLLQPWILLQAAASTTIASTRSAGWISPLPLDSRAWISPLPLDSRVALVIRGGVPTLLPSRGIHF